MNDYLVFNGISSTDCGALIFPKEIDNAPKRDLKKIKVPGRNGSIIIDNGRYEDVKQSYTGIIYDSEKFDEYMNAMRAAVLGTIGYKRLEDSFKPDEYRMAYFDGSFSPDVIRLWKKMGKFELEFTCKPQRYLKIGEIQKSFTSSGGSLLNPSVYTALPFLRVYGYGLLNVGGYQIRITSNSNPYMDIDCERMDAYYNNTNCNNLLRPADDFPRLVAGKSNITFVNTITRVIVKPNWWIL